MKMVSQQLIQHLHTKVFLLILPQTNLGWEYTVEAGVDTSYVPFERNSHLSRRRRWIRVRVCDHNSKALEKKTVSTLYSLRFPSFISIPELQSHTTVNDYSKSVTRPSNRVGCILHLVATHII